MLSEKLRAALDNLLPDDGEDESYLLHGERLRDAAVLIAFTDRPDPGVILTQRPQWLRSHAGQVAFPGGKIDPGDVDAIDAALREAEEEIGLHRHDVTIAGATTPYRSGSGYHITPVLGVIPPDLPLDPNPDEVEDWFEVPLDILFDPSNYALHHANWQGQDRHYYDMDWQGRRIWGVTADIIIKLSRRLPAGWYR
ncbi:CoA pyrophosphatase [Sphingopyxis sp. BSN-002]|uniref:CoA pyrophosphatase n=1 Tax=Sphingopyxis sp. BSN-002 TaxID=2911495 RepID=UPI001EDC3AEF|nr:CoA pyrophosphatase [Sphingopyxis sp. BSN-002]UKK83709.1 CoA pyrophosphatase [Sphingopyxis sp. BSN-002]